MSDLALLKLDGRIARLTLNRADKRNALSLDMLGELHARLDELAANSQATVCVLTGAGPTFCAGMDLKAVLKEPGAPLRLLSSIAELSIKLRRLPQVTIAQVNGAAIGGGCGLIAVCDLAVSHPDAKLGYPEVDLGVCPAVVAPWLVQAVGSGRARRILLQGGTMSGLSAFELGLLSGIVPREELEGEVEKIAQRMASAGPHALVQTKRLLNEFEADKVEQAVRRGAEISAEVIGGEEAQRMLSKIYGQ